MTRKSRKPVVRRALIQDGRSKSAHWLRHGIGALTPIVLGFGLAASAAPTGNATPSTVSTAPVVTRTVAPGVQHPTMFDGAAQTSRTSAGNPLSTAVLADLARNRSSAQQQAVAHRQQTLAVASRSTQTTARALRRKAEALKKKAAEALKKKAAEALRKKKPAEAASRSCLPVSNYTVAARFGDLGPWARYHTGFDFAAAIGTPIHAPRAGVVTHAGSGSAAPWAGNYVTIRYPDGTQSLMAHMSRVSVHAGQKVDACQAVGAVGMTGRAFGPHVHFEIYPARVKPGDIYHAVNPAPWLNKLGLKGERRL